MIMQPYRACCYAVCMWYDPGCPPLLACLITTCSLFSLTFNLVPIIAGPVKTFWQATGATLLSFRLSVHGRMVVKGRNDNVSEHRSRLKGFFMGSCVEEKKPQ